MTTSMRLMDGMLGPIDGEFACCAYTYYLRLAERLSEPGAVLEDGAVRRIVARVLRDKALGVREAVVEALMELLLLLHLFEVDDETGGVTHLRDDLRTLHIRLQMQFRLNSGLREQADVLLAEARQRLAEEHRLGTERRREIDELSVDVLLDVGAIDRLTGWPR